MDNGYNPRTVEEVFRDFKGRRTGVIKALTTGFRRLLLCFVFLRFFFFFFFSPIFLRYDGDFGCLFFLSRFCGFLNFLMWRFLLCRC